MTEISDGQIQTTTLDHLGLVAAICQDLKIAQRIDDRLPCDPQRKISHGRAVIAMILNGLGFTNRRLYLTHQFFESKAIERLLGVEKEDREISWKEGEKGYKTADYKSFYGGIEQRWLLVFSEQAYEREKNTLEKKIEREEVELKQASS